MEFRQLGRDGPQVPVLGLGAWPLGGGMGRVNEQEAIATIRAAIDKGITLIDTAQSYHTSEATIGRALKNGYRERCFLATKVSGDYSREGIIAAMDNSLRALQVSHIDLYQIHAWNPQYPIEESMEAMTRLQQQGKTRYLGVSNFNAVQMQQALQIKRFESDQPLYNLLDRQIEAEDAPFCDREGIGILAHTPLAKGLLTGKYSAHHKFPSNDERSLMPSFQAEALPRCLAVVDRLREVALDKQLSLVQLAIAWLLRMPVVTCVLVGAKSATQVEEHLGAVGVRFGRDELARIEEILVDLPRSN